MGFKQKVLNLTKKIPKGKVTTYGEIARALKTSPRAVGQALKRNTKPVVIPCHRVVSSDGTLGGYDGKLNSKRKIALLKSEGIIVKNNSIQNFEKNLFRFTHT